MNLTKRHWLLAVAAAFACAAVAVALVALPFASARGRWSYSSAPTSELRVGAAPASSPPTQQAPPTQPTGRFLTLVQAQAIAERAVGGRTTEADLDQERTGAVYDVTVGRADGTAYKVIVDAATGRVLRTSVDDEDKPDHDGAPDDLDD